MATQHQLDIMSVITHAGKLTVKEAAGASVYPNHIAVLAICFLHAHTKLYLCWCTCVFAPTRLYGRVMSAYLSCGSDHVFYKTTAIQLPGDFFTAHFPLSWKIMDIIPGTLIKSDF